MELPKAKEQKLKDRTKEEGAKMSDLSEEIVEEILDRLPVEVLMRMKCLSKDWYRLISQCLRSRALFSTSTLVCQYRHSSCAKESQVIFLANKEGESEAPHHYLDSLSFSILEKTEFLGSSSGLLLCKTYRNNDNDVVPYVCNPVLNLWFPLPRIFFNNQTIVLVLSFDGKSAQYYDVVWYDLNKVKMNTRNLKFKIFSSLTGKWRKRRAFFFNSSLIDYEELVRHVDTGHLYRNGLIHWVFSRFMLVYHVQKNFFKIITLPMKRGCLWDSEGCLHYGVQGTSKRFSIFAYDHVIDSVEESHDDVSKKWKFKYLIHPEPLETQLPKLFGPIYVKISKFFPNFFKLLGFNEDMQILYFALPGMVVSYSMETKRLKKVWTFVEMDENDIVPVLSMNVSASFPIQLSGINLPLPSECKLFHPERVSQGSGERPCLLLETVKVLRSCREIC